MGLLPGLGVALPFKRKASGGASGGTVTGSLSETLDNVTLAASGSSTIGTLARTLDSVTLAASGSSTIGTLAETLDNVTMVASGTFTPFDPYSTAVADWVASDYDGSATTWADRIAGKTFDLTGTPPTWNSILECFDFNGTDQFCDATDHADFDYDGTGDFTVAIVMESLTAGQASKVFLSKKQSNVVGTAGWNFRTSSAGALEFLASDGTTQVANSSIAMPTVASTLGVRCTGTTTGRLFVETDEGSTTFSMTTTGSWENARNLRLGAISAPTAANFCHCRIFRVTIWKAVV